MQRRFALDHRAVDFVDYLGARDRGRRQRLHARRAVLINHHAGRQRPQVGLRAAHDDRAEMLVRHTGRRRPVVRAAIVARGLVGDFLGARREARPRRARIGRLRLPHLADPVGKLVGIETAVAVVDKRGESTVREREQRRIGALGRACQVPRAGRGAHAGNAAAADQPHDVDLVRRLVEHGAAALRGVEFLRPARAIEIIRVVQRRDHAHRAERAALNKRAQAQDRRIE